MKKNIVKFIFHSLLFIIIFSLGMNINFSTEKVLFIDNNEALAQSHAGRLCVHLASTTCIWYTDDGEIDFITDGQWADELE